MFDYELCPLFISIIYLLFIRREKLSYSEYSYEDGEKKLQMIYEFSFNKNGFITISSNRDSSGYGMLYEYTWEENKLIKNEFTLPSKYEVGSKEIVYSNLSFVETTYGGVDRMKMTYIEGLQNKQLRTIEEDYFNYDATISWTLRIKYDSIGDIIEKNQLAINGELVEKTYYDYNEKGFIRTSKHLIPAYGTEPFIHTYEYVYDSLGNWLKKTRYDSNSQPIEYIERKITYYN
ncbi:MAG: hypothetical protein GQ574_25590 [Crocinitomix sp.]|nr:hypothetical protein [Crocinitomix sp.]